MRAGPFCGDYSRFQPWKSLRLACSACVFLVCLLGHASASPNNAHLAEILDRRFWLH